MRSTVKLQELEVQQAVVETKLENIEREIKIIKSMFSNHLSHLTKRSLVFDISQLVGILGILISLIKVLYR